MHTFLPSAIVLVLAGSFAHADASDGLHDAIEHETTSGKIVRLECVFQAKPATDSRAKLPPWRPALRGPRERIGAG